MLVALDVREGQRVRRGDRLGTVEIQNANALSADPAAESLDIVARERAQIGARRHLATAASPPSSNRSPPATRPLPLHRKSALLGTDGSARVEPRWWRTT